MAKNLEDARSDIDVMIIGNVTVDAVHQALMKADEHITREVNYSIFSPSEWKKKVRDKTAFASSVAQGQKIFLIGTEDELRKCS